MTLEQQLAELGEELERRHPPVLSSDFRRGGHAAESKTKGLIRATSIAAAIVLALGTVAMLTRNPGVPPIETVAPTVPQIGTAEPTIPIGTTIDGRWTEINWVGPSPTWVTAYPTGGFVSGGLGMTSQFSSDGLTWAPDPFDDTLGGFRDLYVEGGFALANSLPSDFPRIDAWWRPGAQPAGFAWETVLEFVDGSWEALDVGAPVLEPPVRHGGVVLVYPRNPDGTPTDRYLRSEDGASFESHPMPAFVSVAARPEFFTHPGGFGLYQETNRLYLSRDGISWTPVDGIREITSARGGPNTMSFLATRHGLMAQPSLDPNLLRLGENLTWTSRPEPRSTDEPRRRLLSETTAGLVLTEAAPDLTDPFLWVSADGIEWDSIEGPPLDEPLFVSVDGCSENGYGSCGPTVAVAGDSIFYLPPPGEVGTGWVMSLDQATATPDVDRAAADLTVSWTQVPAGELPAAFDLLRHGNWPVEWNGSTFIVAEINSIPYQDAFRPGENWIWRSPDLAEFERIDGDDVVNGWPIAVGDTFFFPSRDRDECDDGVCTVWASTDGSEWTEVETSWDDTLDWAMTAWYASDPAVVTQTNPPNSDLLYGPAVAVLEVDGGVLALEDDGGSRYPGSGTSQFSTDGKAWSAAPQPGYRGHVRANQWEAACGLASNGGAVGALLETWSGDMGVWMSPTPTGGLSGQDGAWTETVLDLRQSSEWTMCLRTIASAWVVAPTVIGGPGGAAPPVRAEDVLVSPDGVDWVGLPVPSELALTEVIVHTTNRHVLLLDAEGDALWIGDFGSSDAS